MHPTGPANVTMHKPQVEQSTTVELSAVSKFPARVQPLFLEWLPKPTINKRVIKCTRAAAEKVNSRCSHA